VTDPTLLEAQRLVVDANMCSQIFTHKGGEHALRGERLLALRDSLVNQIQNDTGSDWGFICGTTDGYKQARELSPIALRTYHSLDDAIRNPWKLDQRDQAP